MTNKQMKEIISLDVKGLEEKKTQIYTELIKLNAQAATGGAIKNTSQIKQLKKTIARLNTLLNTKQGEKQTNE